MKFAVVLIAVAIGCHAQVDNEVDAVDYSKDFDIVQGDLLVPKAATSDFRVAVRSQYKLWPQGVVYYMFDRNYPERYRKCLKLPKSSLYKSGLARVRQFSIEVYERLSHAGRATLYFVYFFVFVHLFVHFVHCVANRKLMTIRSECDARDQAARVADMCPFPAAHQPARLHPVHQRSRLLLDGRPQLDAQWTARVARRRLPGGEST